MLHNDTAGSQAGIAAARALGDLSHKVYAPVVMPQSGAKEGEVLFMDWWQDPKGLMDFFANENTHFVWCLGMRAIIHDMGSFAPAYWVFDGSTMYPTRCSSCKS